MLSFFHSIPLSSLVHFGLLVGVIFLVKFGIRFWRDLGGKVK